MIALGFTIGFALGGIAALGVVCLWWALPIGSSLEVIEREEGGDRD